ncbi:MAG: acyl-CoA dehydrogenase [Firmicutes bacterium]|nr:acyl-CoA dehydrogenase [Bacillota bacterium]
MIFELTEEQKLLKQTVRNFAEKEIAPFIDEWEENSRFSRETFQKAASLGLAGMYIPEEYGGSGMNYFMGALVIEELARAARAMNYLAVHNMVVRQIYVNGTEEQRRKYVLPLARGEKLASICITEPNAGSDISSMQTTAVRDGDEYVLNGTKVFITGGGESDVYTVLCKTDKTKGLNGMTWFILEKGMPGFTFSKPEKKLAFNSVPVCQLFFENVRVPVENRLGEENEGFRNFTRSINGGRINVAAEAVGGAQAALDAAIAYAKERVQFGQPIASFQAIQHMLADMATELEAARLLVYQAAYLYDKGLPCAKEVSMAKRFATDTSMKIATDAVQIFGGYGFIKDYRVERFFREAKRAQIVEGTNQIQRNLIARELLK